MPTPDFSKVWATNSPLPAYTFSDADYLTGWDFVGSAPPTKNEFDAWFKYTDERLNWLFNQLQTTASQIYPVGSVYISVNSTDPSTLFGGTWARLKDTFLLANGDVYAPGSTGGSATKTIATTNLPAHNHTVNSAGEHTHTASTGSAGVHNHSASSASAGVHTHSLSGTSGAAGSHSHTRGSMNITGTIKNNDNFGVITSQGTETSSATGAFGLNAAPKNADNEPDRYDGHSYDINFDASRSWTGSTSTAPNHTHTIAGTAVSAGAHTHGITVNNSGAHTHTVTVNSNGSHTHTTNNTGGGVPLNIMPPYTTVYMWKRTA